MFLKVLLIIHIIAGTLALCTGMISILTTKGMFVHRTSGKIYFWSMLVVAVSALIISIFKNIIFLLAIAIFSFYFTFTGYRSIILKNKKRKWPDIIFAVLCSITCLFMIGKGIYDRYPVLPVFGVLGLLASGGDILKYFSKKAPAKNTWLLNHIGRMMGSYIATTTAFVVVNIRFNPEWIVWLAPTVIGIPVITYFTNKYRRSKNLLPQ